VDEEEEEEASQCEKETEVYSEKIDFSKILQLFSSQTVVLIYLQGFPGTYHTIPLKYDPSPYPLFFIVFLLFILMLIMFSP